MKSDYIIIYTTFPNLKIARKIIRELIGKRFIACANVFKLYSLYTWKGKIEQTKEYGALMKTKKTNYKRVAYFIRQNHPYELPEIIAWGIEKGLKRYLEWIAKETE